MSTSEANFDRITLLVCSKPSLTGLKRQARVAVAVVEEVVVVVGAVGAAEAVEVVAAVRKAMPTFYASCAW